MMTMFFIIVKPLNQPFLNNMEIFNEISLLTCSYFLFMFTDFIPDVQTRYLAGWGFIGVAVMNIAVNWLCLFYKVFVVVKQLVRKKYYTWKYNKLKAAKEQYVEKNAAVTSVETKTEQKLNEKESPNQKEPGSVKSF